MKSTQQVDFTDILNIDADNGTDAEKTPPLSMFCRADPQECFYAGLLNNFCE